MRFASEFPSMPTHSDISSLHVAALVRAGTVNVPVTEVYGPAAATYADQLDE
jgi:hypothetical protein